MNHAVFISYRHKDAPIAEQIRTALEAHDVPCWIDVSGLSVSEGWDEKIGQAITKSRAVLLVITPSSQEQPKQQKREISIAEKYGIPVVPLFIIKPEECDAFDYLLGNTQYLDISAPPLIDQLRRASEEVRRLLHRRQFADLLQRGEKSPEAPPAQAAAPPPAAAGRKRVALLYKRGAQPDETLLAALLEHFSARGHQVFCDRDSQVGEQWRRAIREKVESADAVVPLLSMLSVGSEMLEEELTIARNSFAASQTQPRILPVRILYEGPLPGPMQQALQGTQYALWKGPEDTAAVLENITSALEKPVSAPPTVSRQIEMPTGAVPLSSPFYIRRESDLRFESAIDRQESIILVKGARQMGKTSLIARGLERARKAKYRTVVTDLQTLSEVDFASLETFYRAIAASMLDSLDCDAVLDDIWNPKKAPNTNFDRFMRKTLLPAQETPLVWVIDEADRLFSRDFGTEVFGLIRSWHNSRQLQPEAGWDKLTIAIGYATEASLFIKDVNMSPFNVGTPLELRDFNADEVAELNARYGHPLTAPQELPKLMERVGGQPFLVRRSFYALSVEALPLASLLRDAATDAGIFSDHLRRFYLSLHRDPDLETAVRDFIQKSRPLENDPFQRLRSAGLITGASRQEAKVRCGIYADYLREHLG